MICVIALIVFSVMAIFSASYRPLAKEAWRCVLRKARLKPCDTDLHQRLQAQLAGKIFTKSPRLARIVHGHFDLIAWTLVILTVASLGYTAYGAYNYVQYGNCYGPDDSEAFCPFAALAGEQASSTESKYDGPQKFPTPDDDPSIGPEDAPVTIIEFGCYMCPYTKKAEPTVRQVLANYAGRIRFVYRDFPLPQHAETRLHATAANCAREQDKFWEMHDKLFEIQDQCRTLNGTHRDLIIESATEIGIDPANFTTCLESGKYDAEIENDYQAGIQAYLHGTPTFFINNRTITGPKPYAAFTKIIEQELAEASAQ